MVNKKHKPVPYRRKLTSKTDYKKRLKLLLSKKLRVVVRVTNQRVIAQLVRFEGSGDKVLVGVDSTTLKKMGWKESCKNIPAAYLTGLLLGKNALEKGLKEGVLDTGLKSPQKKGKIFAFLKGVVDSGFEVPHDSENIFPDQDRLEGKHLKNGSVADQIVKQFEEVKKNISK